MKYIGPSIPSVLKYLIKAASEPANTLLEIGERYGGVVHLRIGARHVFLVTSTDGVRHVLQENQHNYRGFNHSHRHFRPLLGNGLLSSDGEVWRRHRSIAQQAFHPSQIRILSVTMAETIRGFLAQWETKAGPDIVLDIGAEFTLLTMSVVTASLFGADIGQRAFIVKDSFQQVYHHLIDRMLNPVRLPRWLPTRGNREFRKALDSLNTVVAGLISNGFNPELEQTNLLGMLKAAHDNDGAVRLDDQELRDEVMTILLAGHETCANALTWTLYLLARHPEVQDCLAQELQRVLEDRPPNYDDIHQLPYTGMVFKEALRLYPPAWIMARDVVDQDEIEGVRIPSGSLVVLSPYVNHRLTSLWSDPAHFDPARFTPDRFTSLPKFAYFPFGGGQRQCLGKNFALVEASLAICLMIQRYHFSLPDSTPDQRHPPHIITPAIDMRPKTPILLKLQKR